MTTHTETAGLLGVFKPDSDEWHEARKGITGTDIGAILGVSPYKSTYTLWAEKRSLVSNKVEPSIPMRLGTLFEEPIRQLFAEQHPSFEVIPTGTWQHLDNPNYKANPDGLIRYLDGDLGILEIKHTSQYWSELPAVYVAQVRWYLYVLGLPFAIVAAVTGGRYIEFTVERDTEYEKTMLDAVEHFERLVATDTEPDYDGSTSTYETVRTLSPGLKDSEIELGHLWVNLSNARDRYEDAETVFKSFKSATLAQMDGAKYGTYNGERVITLQAKQNKPFITFNK